MAMKRRQRRKFTSSDTNICDLPQHIISDILSRVPIKTVVQFMCLCKTLRNSVLEDPHFAKVQLTRSSKTVSLLYPPSYDFLTGENIYLVDEHIKGGRLYCRKSIMGSFSIENFPPAALEIICSCNGLLLCLSRKTCSSMNDIIYICNPIRTSEWVRLPKPDIKMSSRNSKSDYGFAFCHETNQYKVIRVVTTDSSDGSYVVRCEIHTLGSHDWRCIGDAPFEENYRLSLESTPPWILFNGALHWLVKIKRGQYDELFISCFKIHEEQLMLLVPLGPLQNWGEGKITLKVLQNRMAMFYSPKDDSRIDIWVMNNYGVGSWTKRWAIRSNILKGLKASWLKPIKFTEDGELLMSCSYQDAVDFTIVSYNPESRIIRKHKLQGIEYCKLMDHVPSFLSPKDVVMEA